MNNSHNFVPRSRLVNRVLAVVILIGALSSSPAPANVEPPLCDSGCIYWIKGIGCLDCQTCCVDQNHNVRCTHDYDLRDCGTGGSEGQLNQ